MKKIVISLGIIATMMIAFTTAYAYNQNTGYVLGPEAYSGQTTTGSVYSLKSAYAPVTGAETAVYYTNLGYLRSGVCVSSNSRELDITLMEDDATNDDDEVKLYRGTFNGLTLKSIVYRGYATTSSSGNIESASDDTAEFYIKMKLDYITGDKTTTNGPMFSYDIRLD